MPRISPVSIGSLGRGRAAWSVGYGGGIRGSRRSMSRSDRCFRAASVLPLVVLAACASEPPAQAFAACFAPVEPLADPYAGYQGLTTTLSGPVLDAGAGTPPEDCFQVAGMWSTGELVDDE